MTLQAYLIRLRTKMEINQLLLSFASLLLLALILMPVSKKLLFPYPTLLVIAGYLGSELLVSKGFDTGLRWDNFRDLVYYVLLPILIYEVAISLNAEKLFKNLFTILLLGIPLMLLNALITAVILYFGIGHAVGFPVIAALITGLLLSATDSSVIGAILERLKAPPRIVSILEGESLFNNILALIFVSLLIQFVVLTGENLLLLHGFTLFVRMFMGGLMVGVAVGFIGWLLIKYNPQPILRAAVSLATLFGGYLLAESVFKVSGLLAVLVVGLLTNGIMHRVEERSSQFVLSIWQYKAYIARVLLFLLLGVSIRYSVLIDQWIAILIGISAVLVARGFVVLIVFLDTWLVGGQKEGAKLDSTESKNAKSGLSGKSLIFWGNIKGATAIALVLSLPTDISYSYTIQAITYGVVLFSLFVQAPTLRFFIHR